MSAFFNVTPQHDRNLCSYSKPKLLFAIQGNRTCIHRVLSKSSVVDMLNCSQLNLFSNSHHLARLKLFFIFSLDFFPKHIPSKLKKNRARSCPEGGSSHRQIFVHKFPAYLEIEKKQKCCRNFLEKSNRPIAKNK